MQACYHHLSCIHIKNCNPFILILFVFAHNLEDMQHRDLYIDTEKVFLGYLRSFLFLITGDSHVINEDNVWLQTHKQLHLNVFLADYFITCCNLFLEKLCWERSVH